MRMSGASGLNLRHCTAGSRRTPPEPRLVSYFLLTGLQHDFVLLVDHRKAGLWLPTGGRVEPREDGSGAR